MPPSVTTPRSSVAPPQVSGVPGPPADHLDGADVVALAVLPADAGQDGACALGPGADLYPSVHRGRPDDGPRAIDPGLLARVGLQLPSAGEQPLYLRRPDAVAPTTRKSALVSHKRLTIGRA